MLCPTTTTSPTTSHLLCQCPHLVPSTKSTPRFFHALRLQPIPCRLFQTFHVSLHPVTQCPRCCILRHPKQSIHPRPVRQPVRTSKSTHDGASHQFKMVVGCQSAQQCLLCPSTHLKPLQCWLCRFQHDLGTSPTVPVVVRSGGTSLHVVANQIGQPIPTGRASNIGDRGYLVHARIFIHLQPMLGQ